MEVRNGNAWVGENTTLTKKIDLEVHLSSVSRPLQFISSGSSDWEYSSNLSWPHGPGLSHDILR